MAFTLARNIAKQLRNPDNVLTGGLPSRATAPETEARHSLGGGV